MSAKEKVLARYKSAKCRYVDNDRYPSYWTVMAGKTLLGDSDESAEAAWKDAAKKLASPVGKKERA